MLGVRVDVPLFFLCHLLYSFLLAPTVVILDRAAFLNCGKETDEGDVKKKLKSRKSKKIKADSEEKKKKPRSIHTLTCLEATTVFLHLSS